MLPEDRRQQLEPVLRALWEQSPEDSQLLGALSSCRMNVPQRIADLRKHCLHQPDEDPQDISQWSFPQESSTELWAAVDSEKDAMLARSMSRYAPLLPPTQALERLAAGQARPGHLSVRRLRSDSHWRAQERVVRPVPAGGCGGRHSHRSIESARTGLDLAQFSGLLHRNQPLFEALGAVSGPALSIARGSTLGTLPGGSGLPRVGPQGTVPGVGSTAGW